MHPAINPSVLGTRINASLVNTAKQTHTARFAIPHNVTGREITAADFVVVMCRICSSGDANISTPVQPLKIPITEVRRPRGSA